MRWNPDAREDLRAALRKIQAAREQRELLRLSGAEAFAVQDAAKAWAELLDHLDKLGMADELKGIGDAE